MDKEAILAPYRDWQMSGTLKQIVEDSNAKVGHPDYKPNIIAINGPVGSGKSFVADWLKKQGFGFEIMTLTGRLYMAMRFDKLPDTNRSYEEFKALPYGRERLIEASERQKEKYDSLVWNKLLLALQGFQSGNTVFIDNIGFAEEWGFFRRCADKIACINFTESFSGHEVPLTDGGNWVGDSRFPVITSHSDIFRNSIDFEDRIQTWIDCHHSYNGIGGSTLRQILMPTYMGKQESMILD